MIMITIKDSGDFKKTEKYLEKLSEKDFLSVLEKYGRKGTEALSRATPVDTGLTAASWIYEIKKSKDKISLAFKNTNIKNGTNIAIILQYGHGTKNGGYVQGRNYINPVTAKIFDEIAEEAWEEVKRT